MDALNISRKENIKECNIDIFIGHSKETQKNFICIKTFSKKKKKKHKDWNFFQNKIYVWDVKEKTGLSDQYNI